MPIFPRTVLLIALAFGSGNAALADELTHESHAEKGVHCLQLRAIKSVEIIDPQNIVFRLTRDRTFVNRLPRKCAGLRQRDSIMYRTSSGQLCDLDIITMLNDAGFGMTPGASCALGLFYPIDADAIAALKKK